MHGCPPQQGGGGLGSLLQGVLTVVGEADHTVEVVSVYGDFDHTHTASLPPATASTPAPPTSSTSTATFSSGAGVPSACVWVSVRDDKGSFMDPVKLQGLLGLHSSQVSATPEPYPLEHHPRYRQHSKSLPLAHLWNALSKVCHPLLVGA